MPSPIHTWKRQPLLVLLLCLCKHFKELFKRPRNNFDLSGRRPAALGKARVNTVLHSLEGFLVRKRMQRYTFSANLQNIMQLFFINNEDFRKRGQITRKERSPYLIIYIRRNVLSSFGLVFNHRLPVPYDAVLPQGSYVDKRC